MIAIFVKFLKLKRWLIKNDKLFRYGSAAVFIPVDIIYQYWNVHTHPLSLSMLPLGFCDITYMLTIYALIRNSSKVANLALYWSLLGGLLAVLAPVITYGPLHFRFFHYFFLHFILIICNLSFVITGKLAVSSKNNYKAILYGNILSFFIFILDFTLDQNWFFMMYCPVRSISDFLGFPLYTVLWPAFSNLCIRITYLALKHMFSKD